LETGETCLTTGCAFIGSASLLFGDIAAALGSSAAGVSFAMPWFWPLLAGIVGAVAASFSGVVVDRVPEMLGWRPPRGKRARTLTHPPSCCDNCGSRIPPAALVPVAGWLLSRGHCPSCGQGVPPRYPVIEASSALASMAIVAVWGPTWFALASCICLWVLLAASWLDWETQEIPDFVTVPLLFLGLAASPYEPDAITRVWGAVLGGGFVWLAFRLTSGVRKVDAMSYGDIALAAALGGWLGLCGAPYFLIAGSAAYVAYALPFRLRGVVWVPMGPALSLGFMAVALSGLRI